MLEYDWLHWATFLSAALLLNISPGPDIAFIVGQTVARGRASGFAAMFGIWTGALCHVLLAAIGLSAVLAASATAFSIVKWCGVVYLLWLGIKALSSKGGRFELDDSRRPATAKAVFCQGLLVDLLNPKAAVFFIAFLPQFVVPGAGPAWLQLLAHGVLVIAVAGFVEPPVVLASGMLSRRLLSSRRLSRAMDQALGAIFLSMAVRLATSSR